MALMTPADARYLGIDVGTGSARAGVFDARGAMLAAAAEPIELWRPHADFAEQSSDDIWRAVCAAVRSALKASATRPEQVRGLGFDATCSLVALDAAGRPVAVNDEGDDRRNIIVWMDHRAIEQAQRINAGRHEVLRYVGGTISPEMETPKLLWLRERLPAAWRRAAHFFDLPDFLTWRATGDDTRSLCSTVCKWTYLGHERTPGTDEQGRWDAGYFRAIGLGELADEGFRRIGTRIRPLGEAVGAGLSAAAAGELGLAAGTPVSVSIIDAHAGGLGVLGAGAGPAGLNADELESRVALIGGTSSCHMAVSRAARYVPGVWGPYFAAMIPGMWLTEGGQSATGALIDYVIHAHARGAELKAEAARRGASVYDLLNERVASLAAGAPFPAALTAGLHVQPDFHGNRSPRANPTLRGMISGLTLGDSLDDLALLYLATVQAVAHGTRHIIETLNGHGYRIDTVYACGGGTKNPLFVREHADITGCRVVLPAEPEAVLLGGAVLAAVAAGDRPGVLAAMAAMNRAGETIEPAGGAVRRYHAAKHAVFQRMHDDQLAYRAIMDHA